MTRLLLVAAAMLGLGAGVARAEILCPDGSVRAGAEPPDGWSVWCEKGALHHGPYVMWHADGKLMRKGTMYMGALHGRQRSWYRNGQLAEDGRYRHGVRAGVWKRYHRNGKLAARIEYRSGGKPYGVGQWWHANGKLARKAWYRAGKPYRELFWDEEGKRIEEVLTGGIQRPPPQPERASTYSRWVRRERFIAPLPVLTLREASAFVDGAFFTESLCDAALHALYRIVFHQPPAYREGPRRIICERSAKLQLCVALARDPDDLRACGKE